MYERPISPNLPFIINEDAIWRIINNLVSIVIEQVVSRLTTTTTLPITPIIPITLLK